jgi:adenylate cyclase
MADDKSDEGQHLQDAGSSSTQEHVRQLDTRVDELTELLRSQHEMLRQRGITMPLGALESLRTLKTRSTSLAKRLNSTLDELRQLRALAGTTALINSSLDTDTVLNQVMDTVIQLTGAERGYIVLKDRETGELNQFRVARGLDREQLAGESEGEGKKSELIVSKTIVNEVAASGQPVLTDNASRDERYSGQQSIVSFALRSILAVPLKVRDEVIGVVYCDNRIVSGLFQATDRDLLTSFAHQAAVALENARLFESARQQLLQITEMRALLENILDSITSGVITVDADGTILTCNAAASGILGIDNSVRVIGMPLEDLLPPMDSAFYEALDLALSEGVQQLLEVEPILDQYGLRNWNVIVSALCDAVGGVYGIALVLDDLTEQKTREAQLAELRRYLPLALVENIRSVDDVNVSGQERIITMISTDVRGFTTFSERLQPERLMEIINKYLSLASDGINLYEGIVDKYMGDAVTGLFNTQLNPQEDHAERAVRAAMSIIYDLYALHEVMPEDQHLFYGIGIHTGPAYLGNVGSADRKEFAAIGEAVTVSKILEGNAGAGEIIISEATYELVKDVFDCEARAPENTKGRSDINRVYKVVKRKKGARTGNLFLDPELAELLKDLEE